MCINQISGQGLKNVVKNQMVKIHQPGSELRPLRYTNARLLTMPGKQVCIDVVTFGFNTNTKFKIGENCR